MFLHSTPVVGACIATGIERVIGIYKQILEIRKLKNDLEAQNLPEAIVDGVEQHAGSKIEIGVEAIAEALLEEYYQKDDAGRRNELKIDLKLSLTAIAGRIDRGFTIEVRAKQIENSSEEAAPGDSKEREFLQSVISMQKTLQFKKVGGEPILQLPAVPDKSSEEAPQKKKK